MNLPHFIVRRLRALFRKEKLDAEMSEEMRLHLELQERENIRRGMPAEAAAYAAQRSFGGTEQIKERVRDQRGALWFDHLVRDVCVGLRQMRRNPGFALVAILTLGLGTGANTAIFTVVNALLWRTLPVPSPSQLVLARRSPGDASFSYPDYRRFRDQMRSVTGLAAVQNFVTRRWLVAADFGGNEPEPVQAQAVSGNFFSVLGATPALGRTLTSDDDRLGQAPAAIVLSHVFWQRRFGGDPGIVGKVVQLDRVSLVIAGVMPPRFTGFYAGVEPDVWWPMGQFPQVEPARSGAPTRLDAEGWEWLVMVGRLQPNVKREAARAEFDTLFRQQLFDRAATHSDSSEKQRREYFSQRLELDQAATGFTYMRARFVQPLVVLAVVVGVVLLIACANVGGLLLARGVARQREFAVRIALGAGRGRLVRQLLTENLLLALAGGVFGLLFARWGTSFLATYLPAEGRAFDLTPDERVLGFTTMISVLTGLLFGLVPALRSSRPELTASMKFQSGQTLGGAGARLNTALVITQIAMSVMLLAGAGLFGRTLRNLQAADLGFQRQHVVVYSLGSPRNFNPKQRTEIQLRMLQALEAFPGVQSATLASAGLMSGESLGTQFGVEGYTPSPDEDMRVQFLAVAPRFFETLGIPLLRGREFTAADFAAGTMQKVVIGEKLARRFFGDTDPIGRTIRHNLRNTTLLEIIGVAKDTKYRTVRENTPLEYYVPFFNGAMSSPMSFYVRTEGEPLAFASDARAIARQIEPQLVVSELRTLDDVVDGTLVQERVIAQLGGFFSLFALGLASLGLFGLLSYGVTQRTREIGVRVALGATVGDVLLLVVRRGLALALLGCVLGLGGALAMARVVEGLLYNVRADDPLTFVMTAVTLVGVAFIACWLPARRAAQIEPMAALRSE